MSVPEFREKNSNRRAGESQRERSQGFPHFSELVPPNNSVRITLFDLTAIVIQAYFDDIKTTESRIVDVQVPPGVGSGEPGAPASTMDRL